MQISDRYREELRVIYRQRVMEAFESAKRCLAKARRARRSGDLDTQRKWLRSARILWLAGQGWRERAQESAS